MKLVETSILIPTFDNGKYLLECLGSILRQEYQDYEIIIVDDYSNDNTETIITTLAILDPRIKYFKNIKRKDWYQLLIMGLVYVMANLLREWMLMI